MITVAYGSLEAFLKLLWVVITPGTTHGERKEIWRRYGMWLLLGLEFELAADIIGSVVSPSWQDVGKLGAIAVIRTFLNYFLEKDLDSAEASGEIPAPKDRVALKGRPLCRHRRRRVEDVATGKETREPWTKC